MGNSAGSMTEFKSEAGRPIYISDNGEIVSEKSVTIKMGNKFVNVPSIHDGIEYSEDELAEMLDNKEIKPTSAHKSLELAEKAAQKRSPSLLSEKTLKEVSEKYETEMLLRKAKSIEPTYSAPLYDPPELPAEKAMKKKQNMDEQMLTFAEGGLKQEGGTVDPVSGNEVPTGSTKEEVRDDIPAQLSEGEFVFPADVVRYIGLENLMKLRQKAKAGLQKMEDMGQMGNSDEAIMDDDGAYDDEVDSLIDEYDPFTEEPMEFAPGGVVPTTEQMIFGDPKSPVQYKTEEYVGPSGERINITFLNGKPVTPIPEGYKKFDPTKQALQPPKIEAPKAPTIKPVDKGDRDQDQPPATTTPNLGYNQEQVSSILTEINPDLDKAFANKPKGIKDVMMRGLIPSIIASVNYGLEERKAINALEQGYGLSKFNKESTYGKWRSNLDNGYMAAAMLESENEAREISSGKKDWRESNFGSRQEARAVATSGWASEEHFAAIEDEFDEIDSAPSQQAVDDYNRAEIDRAAKEGRQANLADSDSSGPDEDSDDPTKSDTASFGGEDEWD